MDYRELHTNPDGVLLSGVRHFALEEILDCGQCFRWQRVGEGRYQGIVGERECKITQSGDTLLFHGVSSQEFYGFWHGYFDFDRDYGALKSLLSADPVMGKAIAFTPGMRVLRQPPWETLCSFIINANNNIPRIKGIIERLCLHFGEPVGGGHAFPTPQRMAELTGDDLAVVRCGYRAGYLMDAARLVASGQLELEPLYTLSIGEARQQLQRVKGVGPKVAECVLLYGFARAECVPVDVWIRRALDTLYPDGMPEAILAVAGLGQQYLFHYVRTCPEALQAG